MLSTMLNLWYWFIYRKIQTFFQYISHSYEHSKCKKESEAIQLILQSLAHEFIFIALGETMFKSDDVNFYNIHDCNYEYSIRKKRNDGGVSLYIHENIFYIRRHDLSLDTDLFESLFIEISGSILGFSKAISCWCYISSTKYINKRV